MSAIHPSFDIDTPTNMGRPLSNMGRPPTGTGGGTAMTRRSSSGCVGKLTLSLVIFFVLLMVVISIAWLVMDMHEPAFRVMSVSVSNFNVSNTELRGKYEVGITIRNPNRKIELILDHFNVMVFYGQVALSVTSVQNPVYIEKMANNTVRVELFVRDSPKLVHKVVPENLVKEWNKGVVNFDVKMLVRARFEAGVLPSKEKFLSVFCEDLDVGFFSPKDTGKLLGVGKDCYPPHVN